MINGMEEIPDLFNHWAQSLGSIYRDSGDMVIFTAHSLPYKVSEEKEYYSGFVSMAARIAESLGITHWTYAFQSKGAYGSGWLEPSVQVRLEELKTEHFRRVLTVPIGFYYDHLEVLYDLDTIFGNSVRERGLEYVRAQLPNDSDKSVNIIKKGVEEIPDLFNHWAQSLGSIYRDSDDMVIFTAHSLPYKVSEEKEYYSGFVSMAASIAESLGITHWTYAFQSKGTYGSGWLEPSVQLRLEELKTEHFRRVLTVPIGFYYDHLEVLYDLDTIFGNSVRERGLEYVRAQLPNDSDKSVNIIKKGVEMVK